MPQLTDLDPTSFAQALPRIAARAQGHDLSDSWPDNDLAELARCGAMRWALPTKVGGDALSALDLHRRYEQLATASLSTALVLTQRDSAVGLMTDTAAGEPLLAKVAEEAMFTTVGIAQLTTSRQGGKPAVSAEAVGGGYVVSGVVPWCTGAAHAGAVVTGAALADGRQLLLAIDPRAPGVTISEPLPLVALRSTHTAEMTLRDVHVPTDQVLRGPVTGVLGQRKGGLPLGQAFLAMGLCRSALNLIASHTADRAAVVHERFEEQLRDVRTEVLALSVPGREAEASAASARLRGACNSLAGRLTQAAVALFKGSALMDTHPAQRLAREAMFLLVWSCPNPVIECTVDLLSE